ncbi:MAG: hypothetical protein ACKPKO_03350, partial [Candidatus Fonsibacter sp.]
HQLRDSTRPWQSGSAGARPGMRPTHQALWRRLHQRPGFQMRVTGIAANGGWTRTRGNVDEALANADELLARLQREEEDAKLAEPVGQAELVFAR